MATTINPRLDRQTISKGNIAGVSRFWLGVLAFVLAASLLLFVILFASSKSSDTTAAYVSPAVLVYDATGAMQKAVVYPNYPQARIHSSASLYDATGAMQKAIVYPVYPDRLRQASSFYNATRVIQDAVVYSNEIHALPWSVAPRPLAITNELRRMTAPAPIGSSYAIPYDATGAMLKEVVFPTFPK